MTEITMPSEPFPRSLDWVLIQPTQINVSGWTGEQQVLNLGRGWWECTLSLPPILDIDTTNEWRAFVAKAQGVTNTFRVYPTRQNQTIYSGSQAAVNGAAQVGRTLVTDGWPVGITVMKAGRWITIGDQLLQLTADVVSDGTGAATIEFEPPVRTSPADNAVIEFNRPYAIMRMTAEPVQGHGLANVYTVGFSLREGF